MKEKEEFCLTKESYSRLLGVTKIDKCNYCIGIDNATPKSPRKKYKFCPMCGRKR
jgi:hypothetical protein